MFVCSGCKTTVPALSGTRNKLSPSELTPGDDRSNNRQKRHSAEHARKQGRTVVSAQRHSTKHKCHRKTRAGNSNTDKSKNKDRAHTHDYSRKLSCPPNLDL